MMCCLAAPVASAQAQDAGARLPQHDIAFAVGWAGAEYNTSSSYDRWRGSVLLNLTAGRYWTDHLKTEFEVGWLDTSTTEVYTDLEIRGVPTYALVEFDARDIRIGAAQLYQFGRNQWVHPYLGLGVDLVARRTTKRRPLQSRDVYPPTRGTPLVIPALDERASDVLTQPFLKAGFKMYARERVFFTTELKLGITRDVDHAVWKIGAGVDF
jgi:hypothetical protein